MHLIVVGLNHKTANVEIREKCCLAQDKNAVALSMLNDYPFINGSVVLSTCNRVEIYVSTPDVQEGFDNVISFLQTYLSVSLDE
jgi:glutamyl-tRNA reductase